MKTRRFLYIIFGISLILINSYIAYDINERFDLVYTDNWVTTIAYTIGTQPLTIIGVFLLLGAYRVQRKIKRKKKRELENAFTDTGSNQ